MQIIRRIVHMLSSVVVLLSIGAAQQASLVSESSVPRLVNFSGHATDANGKVISGVAGATFAIYRDQDGGAPLWIETQSVAADSKGNFTAQLGATKSDGLPLDVFASGEARWLGVSINGGAEQPRVLLMSVPYALKAADAQTLGGLPPSAFMLAVPSTNGATSATVRASPTSADSSVTAPPPATSNVTTSGGTVNALALFSTSTNIQNSIVSQTGTTSVSVKGKLMLPATGTATSTAGKNSQAQTLAASAFNSTTSTAVPQTFQWQAESANNNTATASGTLNLLFGQGTSVPAETGLKFGSNGQITFATGQTFPGTGAGTITGVTTGAGSGLSGGGTSGTLNLGLLSTCSSNQILKWNGSAWACASDANSGGTVTSVALAAPSSDFTVTGSPITSSGTLALNWAVAPDTKASAYAIAKRDGSGGFNVGWLNASMSNGSSAIAASDTSNTGNVVSAISGNSVNGAGVSGSGGFYGLYGSSGATGVYGTGSIGVSGNSTSGTGLYGSGSVGVYGASPSGGFGIEGTSGGTAIYGTGGSVGVGGYSNNGIGVNGTGIIGVDAESSSGGGEGLFAYDSSNGDGILAGVQSSSGYAAWFNGTVDVNGNLIKPGGSFRIDHPLDPANKYLSHSFVESPDMMNIYNGNATLDADGEAVIEMPEWFGALNRDFRYQLTCIGGFAPVYVAEELSRNHFKIGGGKPGMRISWQITGVRQDAWANAHRIPVEEEKPAAERGTYLHPELYGASEEDALVWRRHPETWKHLKQQRAKASAKP